MYMQTFIPYFNFHQKCHSVIPLKEALMKIEKLRRTLKPQSEASSYIYFMELVANNVKTIEIT